VVIQISKLWFIYSKQPSLFLWINSITLTVREITSPITDTASRIPKAAPTPIQLSSEASAKLEVGFAVMKAAITQLSISIYEY